VVLIVQGVLAILFGATAIMMPDLTLVTLIAIFGATAILDGAVSLVGAFTSAGPTLHAGCSSCAVLVASGRRGRIQLAGLTALLLIYVIAARFLMVGVLEIVSAVSMRKEIDDEWLLVVSGVLSIAAGIWFFLHLGRSAHLAWLTDSSRC